MKEVIERILTKHRVALKKIGISQPIVETRGDSPYLDTGQFQVAIRWMGSNGISGYFFVRMHYLFGCCGVIELNRPYGPQSQPQFDAVMDVLMEGIHWQTDPKTNPYELWGNQILATTSTESNRYFRPYLVSRRWQKFRPAKNPRTENPVTIWKKTL